MKTFKISMVAVAFALMLGMFGGSSPALADRDYYNHPRSHQYHGYQNRHWYNPYRYQNRSYYYNPYRQQRRHYRRRNSHRNFYFNFGGHGFGFRYGY